MGARQSKRSVDISGKEAESAGEVAAAGAGGEGRVEQLADADALKPQINGDAHIHEQSEKEKELDSGTPENEKDATTEKEAKENGDEKEPAPVTNGNTEQKSENGEPVATPEDGKKPKKEKVKKKWSLRSISFSRKDKPKQEKKQKDEEAKTNGEPEKVLEETTEATAEQSQNETTEAVKTPSETKDDKTPETPVTEPITNGHSTPETPQEEIPATEQQVEQVINSDEVKTENKAETEPEQLPVNGLSLEESKTETPEFEVKTVEIVESKVEDSAFEKEVVPVPEIPVKKEVCVEQIPLIEPSPPPLPANPPPSSVASFAATTMAPEMTDASLSNTAEITFTTQEPAVTNVTIHNDTHAENPVTDSIHSETNNTTPPPIKDEITEKIDAIPEIEQVNTTSKELNVEEKAVSALIENSKENINVCEVTPIDVIDVESENVALETTIEDNIPEKSESDDVKENVDDITPNTSELNAETENNVENDKSGEKPLADITVENMSPNDVKIDDVKQKEIEVETVETVPIVTDDKTLIEDADSKKEMCSVSQEINSITAFEDLPEVPTELTGLTDLQSHEIDFNNDVDELPPPPPLSDDEVSAKETLNSAEVNDITAQQEEPATKETMEIENPADKNIDNTTLQVDKSKIVEKIHTPNVAKEISNDDVKKIDDAIIVGNNDETQMNGIATINENEEAIENNILNQCTDLVGNKAASDVCNGTAELTASDEPSDLPQEPLPLSDKMDLIPDVPVVPELKTETETSTDVAVAN